MIRYVPFVAYIVFIAAANWLTVTYSPITVLFTTLVAPAGVYMAGLTFTARNLTQQTLGRRWGFVAIIIGAILSGTVFQANIGLGGPLTLPLASGLTFLLSETADALVWTKLREWRWWVRAMLLGDIAGQVIDSLIFLLLAFGSLDLLAGQIVGKWWTLIPAVVFMWIWKQRAVLSGHPSSELASAD